MDVSEVVALLRTECAGAGSGAKWARDHGLSPPYVYDVLRGRMDPGPGILEVLGGRGFRIVKVVSYELTAKREK